MDLEVARMMLARTLPNLPLISTHLLSRALHTSLNRTFWLSVFLLDMLKLSIMTSSLRENLGNIW